jgi:putative CocE/NonD family hydrolase
MSLMSKMLARMYKLPPAEYKSIAVEKGLEVRMLDGVILRADRHYPRNQTKLPTILVRTPYGRAGYGAMGSLMAEQGFQVLIQSCRGTDDSEGKLNAFRGEREDGLATVEWLKQQPWFDGRLGMTGPSYLGFTQWALARDASSTLKAFSTHVTSSEFRSVMHPGGSFNLEVFLQWMQITDSYRGSIWHTISSLINSGRRLKAAIWHLLLYEADTILLGKAASFWRDWLEHSEPGNGWWDSEDFSTTVGEITAPNHLVTGWYDFLFAQLLRDYASLEAAGRKPYLTIGPWSHSSNGMFEVSLPESIHWLRAHLLGKHDELRSRAVRIYVMGAEEWREMETWPPSNAQAQRRYLQGSKTLSETLPVTSEPSQYRYDPADPTPNVGGATNATLGRGTGQQDNRKLETRADVLVFTSPVLESDLEIIGTVQAELFVHSSLEHTDFFMHLCDVYPDGKSLNVCDAILRVFPDNPAIEADGTRKLEIALSPTAYRFKRGHCIRLQVSSGAFPRFDRNLGIGKALGYGTNMKIAEQKVYHDSQHLSLITLPVSN